MDQVQSVHIDDMNTTVSFYDSGAVATFLLDMELRSRTSNRVSMDSVMQEMVRFFPDSGSGYTRRISLKSSAILQDSIRGLLPALYQRHRSHSAGRARRSRRTATGPGFAGTQGLFRTDLSGTQFADYRRYVLSDGPAHMAGVLPGDEVVALNGRRYNAAQFAAHVELI
jgi:predicted metalloprotease with PDZ domain